MKCKCWIKLTLFSKDYVSHSLIAEILSNKGQHFIQDEKLLDIKFNLQCNEWRILHDKIYPHIKEGYGAVDIKCWGAEINRLMEKSKTVFPGYYLIPVRSEKKEIKLKLLPESNMSNMNKTKDDYTGITNSPTSEKIFLIPIDHLLGLLPFLEEFVEKLSNASDSQ